MVQINKLEQNVVDLAMRKRIKYGFNRGFNKAWW